MHSAIFYTTSELAWTAMRADILASRKSIYWESYIFVDDVQPHGFIDLLILKSREGVRVKVITDPIGSFSLAEDAISRLRDAGVELLYFNHPLPWFYPTRWLYWLLVRTHRKLLVIDDAIGFIGGVNVGNAYRRWLDLHVRVTQPKIVRQFVRSFARLYRLCGGTDRIIVPPKTASRAKLWLLEHLPFHGRLKLKKFYLAQCASAKRHICIATPYFIPHRWLMSAFCAATRRGVIVEIILPLRTDIGILDFANRVSARRGARFGVRFFFVPDMIHAKALLVDDRAGLVGSNNLDARSFDYSAEASVVFRDPHMVGDLRDIFEHWKSMTTPYIPPAPRWYDVIFIWIVRVLQPIL